jgi:hypothetical protein
MPSILFFSRGRGYGHALPDLAISRHLAKALPASPISFASYSTGFRVLSEAGVSVTDLGLPENNAFVATLDRAQRLIRELNPTVVISHEEFAAVVAARMNDVPSAFISAWLPQPNTMQAEALTCASSIIVLERPGLFLPLPGVSAKPKYTGRMLRDLCCKSSDREQLRTQLGIEQDEEFLLVISGGWANEQRAPIADTVISSYLKLARSRKRLRWLAGSDAPALRQRLTGIPGVEVSDYYDPVEHLIAVADIVISKGTRGTTLDANALGTPSISLSHGLNPVDDLLVPRISSNLALRAPAVDADVLCEEILKRLDGDRPPPGTEGVNAREVSAAILEELLRISPSLR